MIYLSTDPVCFVSWHWFCPLCWCFLRLGFWKLELRESSLQQFPQLSKMAIPGEMSNWFKYVQYIHIWLLFWYNCYFTFKISIILYSILINSYLQISFLLQIKKSFIIIPFSKYVIVYTNLFLFSCQYFISIQYKFICIFLWWHMYLK